LLSKAIPYAGGTISCFLSQLLMNKQLLSKSNPTQVVHPYAGGTSLRWWYIPTLVVHPYAGGTDAADQSSHS